MSDIETDENSIPSLSDDDSLTDSIINNNDTQDNLSKPTYQTDGQTETESKMGGSIVQLDTDIESLYHHSDVTDINNYKYDIININTTYNNLSKKKITRNILTKFEKTLLLGIRCQQLINGSEPMIDASNYVSIKEIVKEELRQKNSVLIEYHRMVYEDWSLHELHYSI